MGSSLGKIRLAIYEDFIFYMNNVRQMTKSKNLYTNPLSFDARILEISGSRHLAGI